MRLSMILHTKSGKKIKGRFLQKCRNAVVVETEHEGPYAIGLDQLRSVERQPCDQAGANERGQPVHPKDAANLNWPGRR